MRLTPARLNDPSRGQAFSSSPHSAFSTEAVSLTVPGMVFKAGWAYRAYIRGLLYGNASGILVHFRLRQTGLGGADYGEYGRVETKGTAISTSVLVNGAVVLTRSAGTDLTTDVALCVSAGSGTGTLYATSASPRYLCIEPIGPASEYLGLGVDV
jgi:hypothetical protein